jgi:hypothetical protein
MFMIQAHYNTAEAYYIFNAAEATPTILDRVLSSRTLQRSARSSRALIAFRRVPARTLERLQRSAERL